MTSSMKMAFQARKAKGMADDLAEKAGDSTGAKSSKKSKAASSSGKLGEEDEDLDEDSGADEELEGSKKNKIKGEKNKLEVSDFFDDLMEGFAELWRLAVAGGHSFASCRLLCVAPSPNPGMPWRCAPCGIPAEGKCRSGHGYFQRDDQLPQQGHVASCADLRPSVSWL
ncbi:kidins220 [Symbiodinium sp. CCMP2456]|nr:kidins220 [Symbiodinium sp. CCMP2456]